MVYVPLSNCGACCPGSHCLAGGTTGCPNICCTCCWSRLREKITFIRHYIPHFGPSVKPRSLTGTQITHLLQLAYNILINKSDVTLIEYLRQIWVWIVQCIQVRDWTRRPYLRVLSINFSWVSVPITRRCAIIYVHNYTQLLQSSVSL